MYHFFLVYLAGEDQPSALPVAVLVPTIIASLLTAILLIVAIVALITFRPWRSSSATKQLRGQNILPSTSSLATWIAEILQRKLSITDLFLLFPGCAQNKHQRFSQLWRWYYCCWQCYTIWKCSWRGRIRKQNRPFCYWWFIRKWRLWKRLLYCGGTINGFIRLCCWHPVYKPVSVRLNFCKSS